MDEITLSFSVALFASLAHPTRLRIVELLTAAGEMTVSELADRLEILQPNASQHLAALQRAGVVKVHRVGATRCYSLRGPRIPRILALVDEFRQKHATDLERIHADNIKSGSSPELPGNEIRKTVNLENT